MNEVYNCDCLDFLKSDRFKALDKTRLVVVTDPPFNIGYHYGFYKDRMDEKSYFSMLSQIVGSAPYSVIIHYPEALHRLSMELGRVPEKVVSWVYNSNTAKQHRDIAFYGIRPDMGKVRQPYKNPNDKRIRQRIANGSGGQTL